MGAGTSQSRRERQQPTVSQGRPRARARGQHPLLVRLGLVASWKLAPERGAPPSASGPWSSLAGRDLRQVTRRRGRRHVGRQSPRARRAMFPPPGMAGGTRPLCETPPARPPTHCRSVGRWPRSHHSCTPPALQMARVMGTIDISTRARATVSRRSIPPHAPAGLSRRSPSPGSLALMSSSEAPVASLMESMICGGKGEDRQRSR